MDLYGYSPSYQMILLEQYIYCYCLETKHWMKGETLGFGLYLDANSLGDLKKLAPLDYPSCEEMGWSFQDILRLCQAVLQSHSQSTSEPQDWKCWDSVSKKSYHFIQPRLSGAMLSFTLNAPFQNRQNILHACLTDCTLANLERKPSSH